MTDLRRPSNVAYRLTVRSLIALRMKNATVGRMLFRATRKAVRKAALFGTCSFRGRNHCGDILAGTDNSVRLYPNVRYHIYLRLSIAFSLYSVIIFRLIVK